jgi:hypothetical protein
MKPYQGDETTGFQSPAQDYIEPVVDLARLLDLRRPGLYPVRVIGNELRARGIFTSWSSCAMPLLIERQR